MAGVLMVCLAACLWGTVGVVSTLLSTAGDRDPALLGLTRTALGAASLLLSAWLMRRPSLPWRDVPFGPLVIFGIAGASFQICLFSAFAVVGVTVTVAVTVCAPVLIVAAADAIPQREAPAGTVMLAMVLGFTGVLFAMPEQDAGEANRSAGLYGAALLAGASLSFAALAMVTRTVTRRLDPVRTAGLGLAASAAALAVILGFGTTDAHVPFAASGAHWDLAILLYIGVVATGGAYLAFVLGTHMCSSASVGLAATMIEPGVAAALATLVLQERLTALEITGCALMMLAMVLLTLAERNNVAPPCPTYRENRP